MPKTIGKMARIRRVYGVPARRGADVVFGGVPYIITGTSRGGLYLKIRPTAGGPSVKVHPTWAMEYSDSDGAVVS